MFRYCNGIHHEKTFGKVCGSEAQHNVQQKEHLQRALDNEERPIHFDIDVEGKPKRHAAVTKTELSWSKRTEIFSGEHCSTVPVPRKM